MKQSLKFNSFLLIFSGIIIILMLVIMFFMLNDDEFKVKECNELKNNEKNEMYAESYFDLLNVSNVFNTGRGTYLSSEWINDFENKNLNTNNPKYEKFIEKLLDTFENETTFVENEVTYSFIDHNNEKVYLILKPDGTVTERINECQGYSTDDRNYKIVNDEIVLIDGDPTIENNDDILFLYEEQKVLQAITYRDCGSISPGTILFME